VIPVGTVGGSDRPRAATQRSCDSGRSIALPTQSGQLLPQSSSLEVPRLPCRDHRVWLDERAIDLLAFHAKTRWSRTVLGMFSSPPVSRSGIVWTASSRKSGVTTIILAGLSG